MKLLILSGLCLLVGLGVGGYIGYHWNDRRVTNEAVKLMVAGGESAEAEQAARATRAIALIEAGQSQEAVQMLSKPIAQYYGLYSGRADTEMRRRVCAMIAELASTNAAVAQELSNEVSYSQSDRKER